MKVRILVPSMRALLSATLVVAFMATLSFSAPEPASAITREQVIKRGKVWVKKKVSYSQYRTYGGYRRDCSGFVSMAWKLGRSYTTRTISSRARRVKVTNLRPGDAVLVPGHVSLFAGWKSKKNRTYWALEETTWGSHAKKRVRKIPRNAKALRYKKITKPRVLIARAPAPKKTVVPTNPPVTASVQPSTVTAAVAPVP